MNLKLQKQNIDVLVQNISAKGCHSEFIKKIWSQTLKTNNNARIFFEIDPNSKENDPATRFGAYIEVEGVLTEVYAPKIEQLAEKVYALLESSVSHTEEVPFLIDIDDLV